ncbi:MAG: hypothetical protein IT561_16360 [Alphaproteobacteria bacterium]|nr:hypothetical protein [Alphaproteobacteria bacterium]
MFDIDALVRDVMEHGAAGEAARRNAAARRPLAGGCEIGAAAPAKRDEKDEQ